MAFASMYRVVHRAGGNANLQDRIPPCHAIHGVCERVPRDLSRGDRQPAGSNSTHHTIHGVRERVPRDLSHGERQPAGSNSTRHAIHGVRERIPHGSPRGGTANLRGDWALRRNRTAHKISGTRNISGDHKGRPYESSVHCKKNSVSASLREVNPPPREIIPPYREIGAPVW